MRRDAARAVTSAISRWWLAPLPLGRIAALRVGVYLFAWYDVFVYSPPVPARARVTGAYRPLAIERFLHLPTPTHAFASAIQIAVPCFATLAATGRAPRVFGWITFVLYLDWITMGDSYGYVAHDRFAFIVALAVLPTVGAARRGDLTTSERAGWALRCIEVAVVATYFLSVCAKLRFGGINWANGSVLTWAVLRRGTPLGRHLLHHPTLLHISQWGLFCAEALSPIVLFLRGRWVYVAVGAMLSFHLISHETIGISFLPHVVCIFAFLPLERIATRFARTAGTTPPEALLRRPPRQRRPAMPEQASPAR
ncbi:MAG TPA: hypothetical protein VHC43_01635 [Mycobacteriales bacterium]|nr:hypothetical protein [Mycobacteriales bacterium]